MTNAFDTEIGRRIRSLRLIANMSAKLVAATLHLDIEDYEHAEAGRVRFTPGQLIDLARLFAVPLSALFGANTKREEFSPVPVAPPRRPLRAH